MITNCTGLETFEISPRFRQSVEERIARLERDADYDEAQLVFLTDKDHIRRHQRLVMMQRAEALRMQIFLDRAKPNVARAMIVH
jgi:ribosome-associated translation inhibitor RaiA